MNKQDLFIEIEYHLLDDQCPSSYINRLLADGMLRDYPFTMLTDLSGVDQNEKYHPEGSVWNHTMLVVDEAAKRRVKSRNTKAFMWAALLHDIGKAPTTRIRNGRITAYNHEKEGKKMASEFLNEFSDDSEFINNVIAIIRWHMEPLFSAKNLPYSNIRGMLNEVSLDEIALFSICDRIGRGDMTDEKIRDEKKGVEDFVRRAREFSANT